MQRTLGPLQAVGLLPLASIARTFGDVARMGATGTTCARTPVRTVIHAHRCMGLTDHTAAPAIGVHTRIAVGVITIESDFFEHLSRIDWPASGLTYVCLLIEAAS